MVKLWTSLSSISMALITECMRCKYKLCKLCESKSDSGLKGGARGSSLSWQAGGVVGANLYYTA